MFFVLSWAWDKEKILSAQEDSNLRRADSALWCATTEPRDYFSLSHARDKTKNISLGAVLLMMGHFSCECLYIKTNVITATNHTKVKCYKKPLRTQRQNMLTTRGAGKCHRPIRDWFKFASDWSVSGHKSFSDQSTIIFQFRVLIRRRLPSRLFFLVVQARIFWLQSWNV